MREAEGGEVRGLGQRKHGIAFGRHLVVERREGCLSDGNGSTRRQIIGEVRMVVECGDVRPAGPRADTIAFCAVLAFVLDLIVPVRHRQSSASWDAGCTLLHGLATSRRARAMPIDRARSLRLLLHRLDARKRRLPALLVATEHLRRWRRDLPSRITSAWVNARKAQRASNARCPWGTRSP